MVRKGTEIRECTKNLIDPIEGVNLRLLGTKKTGVLSKILLCLKKNKKNTLNSYMVDHEF